MEHIKNKAKKALIGKYIKCRFCGEPQARIGVNEANRYMVHCYVCRMDYYLKEQHNREEVAV